MTERTGCAGALLVALCAGAVIAPAQTFTAIKSFNGELPEMALVEGADGIFFGTATQGEAYDGGTVFQPTSSGALTVLYPFCTCSDCSDGFKEAIA
jgi:uncharacterized repeat protein (TIGR03803 family)